MVLQADEHLEYRTGCPEINVERRLKQIHAEIEFEDE